MSEETIRAAADAAEDIELEAHDDAAPPPEYETEEERPPEWQGARFPLNDFGNGQRLNHYCGEDILFVPRMGWFVWEGRLWEPDEDELLVRGRAQGIADRITREIRHIKLEPQELNDLRARRAAKKRLDELEDSERGDIQEAIDCRRLLRKTEGLRKRVSERRKSHRAHARAAGNSAKITAMLGEARVAKARAIEDLNADPLTLNTESATLRFVRTRGGYDLEVLDHDRDHLISKMCAAPYDVHAEAPTFARFLEQIQPDPAVRDFLQRWFGYAATGLTTEQALTFFFGAGRNGKSTLVDVIAKILDGYATTLPIETLTGTETRKGSDATPDLVRLPGARFVRSSEPEQGQRMKEALVKALTGGEPIPIRRMHQEFVEITPIFKLTISGNHKPEIRGADDGIWRRVLLVPFAQQIPRAEVDPDLPAKLWAERAGILNWIVTGAIAYLEGGLAVPEVVRAATEDYRQESDPVREFLLTEVELTGCDSDWAPSRELIEAFNAWRLVRGESVWGKRATANGFKDRAGVFKDGEGRVYTYVKRSDSGYSGLIIKPDALERLREYRDDVRQLMQRKG